MQWRDVGPQEKCLVALEEDIGVGQLDPASSNGLQFPTL